MTQLRQPNHTIYVKSLEKAIDIAVKHFITQTIIIDITCPQQIIKDLIVRFLEKMHSATKNVDVLVKIATLIDEQLAQHIAMNIKKCYTFIIEKNIKLNQKNQYDLDYWATRLADHIHELIRHGRIGILIISSIKTLNTNERRFIEKLVDTIKWDASMLFIATNGSHLHHIAENIAKKYYVKFQKIIII